MVTDLAALPRATFKAQVGYRLINSKYPPIHLFNDVASNEDFDALYAVQALTNPRLRQEVGDLNLVPRERRPFGIPGCSYALGPFVHINSSGSRFSAGLFGVFYAAETIATGIAETRYHQQRYFQGVADLKYDRIQMRGLRVVFSASLVNIYCPSVDADGWYNPDDYNAPQQFGAALKKADGDGVLYASVRDDGNPCYALFSPHLISIIVQTGHYEYQWDGKCITSVVKIVQQ